MNLPDGLRIFLALWLTIASAINQGQGLNSPEEPSQAGLCVTPFKCKSLTVLLAEDPYMAITYTQRSVPS